MTDPLSPEEEAVWRALARLVVVLPRAMTADLQQQCQLTLTEYSVLLHLSEAQHQSLRMSDLADLLLVSAAQTTRLVQDMEKHGYLTRSRSTVDGRGTIAALTPLGIELLSAAWPIHLESTRRLVVDHLPKDLMADMRATLEPMVTACENGRVKPPDNRGQRAHRSSR